MSPTVPSTLLALTPCHSPPQTHCATCRLSALCLPISLQLDDVERLDRIVQRGRPMQKSERLYHAGEPFASIYAVRSGSVKTVNVTQDGQEQITGFYLPGEIIGMDGIASGRHTNDAVALETSAVCEIPFAHLEELTMQLPNLQRRLFQIMSQEITNDQQLITLLGKNNAEARIAALMLSISARNHGRGLSADEFYLPMSRGDIGNYLGLTIETVSRVMGKLHRKGIINLDKKHVVVKDREALHEIATHNQTAD
jgi:CRP/FNR family transcriptional regulator, anaerobic regulatory protein